MTREESFEVYYNSFKNTYKNILSDQQIIDKVNWLLDKQEFLPKGKKSITVQYYDFLLEVDEIEKFKKDLNSSNIELGHYNKSGDFYNAFEFPDILIIINDPIVIGVAANLTTELIKSIFRKVRGKKITKISGKKEETKEIIFEVVTRESKNKKSSFKIKGDLTDKQIDKLIDKIPEITAENDKRSATDLTDLDKKYVPDHESINWEDYDLIEQIKLSREIQEKKKKEKNH